MKTLLVFLLVFAVIWCVGDLLLGAVAAPSVFSFAPPKADVISRAVAGALFGEILDRWMAVVDHSLQILVPGLLLVLTGAAISLRRRAVAALCVLAVIGLLAVHTFSRNALTQALACAPPIDATKPYSSEQQATFIALHDRSKLLFGTESVLLLFLVVGAGFTLAKHDRVETSALPPVR